MYYGMTVAVEDARASVPLDGLEPAQKKVSQ